MKTKKRGKILSLLLALSMLVGMVPLSVIPAMAAGGSDGTETIDPSVIPVMAADGTGGAETTDPPVIKSKWAYNPDPEWVGVNNRNGDGEGLRSLERLLESSINNHIPLFIQLTSDAPSTGS